MLLQRARYARALQVSNAAMMTMSGRVLSERLDALRLTFYTAPVSCLILLPFYHWHEVRFCRPPCFNITCSKCANPSCLAFTACLQVYSRMQRC